MPHPCVAPGTRQQLQAGTRVLRAHQGCPRPCWARCGSAASSSWPWTTPPAPPMSPRPVSATAPPPPAPGQPPGLLPCAGAAPHPNGAAPCCYAVYVLDELVQALGAGDSRAGVDALCARLAHRSPVVKQKVGRLAGHGWLLAGQLRWIVLLAITGLLDTHDARLAPGWGSLRGDVGDAPRLACRCMAPTAARRSAPVPPLLLVPLPGLEGGDAHRPQGQRRPAAADGAAQRRGARPAALPV